MPSEDNFIYSIGHAVENPINRKFPKHMHNDYEIIYFLSGDSEYIIEGSVYKMCPRDLLFIHPRTFHHLNPLSDKQYERFVLRFSEFSVDPVVKEFITEAKEIYKIPKGHIIDTLFEHLIFAEKNFSPQEKSAFEKRYIDQILINLKHLEPKEEIPSRKRETLDDILQYIDENPEENITASSLSERFFVSTSWLVHTFKSRLGISLMQYVNKKRILYAEWLIRGGLSPTDTQKRCNFESYSTFYRQYVKILGHSPQKDVR